MKRRFVHLEAEEIRTIEDDYKNVAHHQIKQRCYARLLSHKDHQMQSRSTIFPVSLATISNWFTAWKTKGVVGLRNQAGQRRKPILTQTDLPLIKGKVQLNPQHLKAVRTELEAELARDSSEEILKRLLKRLARPLGDGAVPRRDVSV